MAFTLQQQRIYTHLRSSLPKFLFQKSTSPQGGTSGEEFWGGFTILFDAIWTQVKLWHEQSFIKGASGIWLDQHAKDRGTARQDGEDDDTLIKRLTIPEDVVTKPALKAGVDAILTVVGAGTTCTIIELRQYAYRCFFGIYTSDGRAKTYFSRGYRLTSSDHSAGFVVICPYPTSTDLYDIINEYVLRAKAAGIHHTIEIRATA